MIKISIRDPVLFSFTFGAAVLVMLFLVAMAYIWREPAPAPVNESMTSGPTGFRKESLYGPVCYIITIDGMDVAYTSGCVFPESCDCEGFR